MNALATPIPLNADEFLERFAHERFELVAGFLQETPMPQFRHGWLCALLTRLFGNHIDASKYGQIVSHDTFIRLKQDPDTVRGPDIAIYSYDRLPAGKIPSNIIDIMPDVVIEVKSPSDRWSQLHTKINEYLQAGIRIVLAVDDDDQTVTLFRPNGMTVFTANDIFTMPELPGLAIPLTTLFHS